MKRLVSLTLVLVLVAMVGGSPLIVAAVGGAAGTAAGALWEDVQKSLGGGASK